MLYNFKQHINTIEAFDDIHIPFKNQFILVHLFLRIHRSIGSPGLDPPEGSRRLSSFNVWLHDLESRPVFSSTGGGGALVWHEWSHDCSCMCLLSCLYSTEGMYSFSVVDIFQIQYPLLNLFRLYNPPLVLSQEQAPQASSGELILVFDPTAHPKYLHFLKNLILFLPAGVCITAYFPVNWPQCHRPGSKPFVEWFVFEGFCLVGWLPLVSLARRVNHFLQFRSAQLVPYLALLFVFRRQGEGESSVLWRIEFNSFLDHVEEDHLLLPHASTQSNDLLNCILSVVWVCMSISKLGASRSVPHSLLTTSGRRQVGTMVCTMNVLHILWTCSNSKLSTHWRSRASCKMPWQWVLSDN